MNVYFLQPDWRHMRCCELINQRHSHRRFAKSTLVRCYVTYLRWVYDHAATIEQSVSLPNIEYLDETRFLYRIQHDDRCRQLRFELETRILADQPREAIANAMGLSKTEVAIFEYLYFAVRDRLNQPEYIHGIVIQEWKLTDPDELFIAAIKKLAYHLGVALLDTVLLLGRIRQAGGLKPPNGYLQNLRDVLDRIDRSELRSFLATNSRQGLQIAILRLLETLFGKEAASEIAHAFAATKSITRDIEVEDANCLIEAAQIELLRAA